MDDLRCFASLQANPLKFMVAKAPHAAKRVLCSVIRQCDSSPYSDILRWLEYTR